MLRGSSLYALLLLLGGCDLLGLSGSGDVVLTTVEDVYAPGEALALRIKNNTSETIGFNLCFSGIERQVGDGWRPLVEPDKTCPLYLKLLEPGKTTTGSI